MLKLVRENRRIVVPVLAFVSGVAISSSLGELSKADSTRAKEKNAPIVAIQGQRQQGVFIWNGVLKQYTRIDLMVNGLNQVNVEIQRRLAKAEERIRALEAGRSPT